MTLSLDYSGWRGQHREWSTVDTFVDAGPAADGVHSLQGHGLPLDLLVVNGAKIRERRQRVLPIFFSGAVSTRSGRPGPFFSGRGMADSGDFAAVCIADPTLALDDQLGLAWYAGSHVQPTQRVLFDLLAGIAEHWGLEPLLVGGSGAGFAALQLGARLGTRASALVWNPQTDLLAYYRAAVIAYLRTAFPHVSLTDAEPLRSAAAHLAQHGVVSELATGYAAGDCPRRLVYVQNVSDHFHVLHHAGPFINAIKLTAEDNRYLSEDRSALVWFGAWGRGHEPIPKPALGALLDCMLDPEISAGQIADRISCMPGLMAAEDAVRPLSFDHAAKDAVLRVEARTDADAIMVRAMLEGSPRCTTPPEFAFYVFSGRTRIQQRWYGPDASAVFPLLPGQPPSRVVGFARDSFGKLIQTSLSVGLP